MSANSSSPRALTARQREVLEAIQKYVRRYHIVPSIREIGAELGIASVNGVRGHLEALRKKGYIQRTNRFSRSIVLLDDVDPRKVPIPVIGRVVQYRLEKKSVSIPVTVPGNLFWGKKDCFLIHFADQSFLSEYFIQKDDFLMLRSTRSLNDGEKACILDASNELYLVQCQWDEEEKRMKFYSCGKQRMEIKIVQPLILGVIVTMMRFSF